MLKALIFDIDVLLPELSNYNFQAWKLVFSTHNIKISKEDWHMFNSISHRETIKQILEFYKKTLSFDQIEKMIVEKSKLYTQILEEKINSNSINFDIKKIISEAKSRDLKLAISSYSRNAVLITKKMRIFNKFDYVIDYSDKTTNGLSEFEKDAIIPIKLVLSKIETLPCECIVFDNNCKSIKLLNELGAFCVGVAYGDHKVKSNAKFWVDSPNEIELEPIIFDYYKND